MSHMQPAPQSLPWVTRLLLISWALPQIAVLVAGPALEAWLTQTFALIPAHLSAAVFGGAGWWPIITLGSSTFLHAGLLHLGANALFMLMVAPPLERTLGAALFFSVYVITALAAGLAQWLSNSADFVAVVGASGGISGLFGAYVVLFARRTVPDKIILGLRLSGSMLFILWQLAAWLAIQAFTGFAFNSGSGGGVAVWAHIGGFAAGLLCGVIARPIVIKRLFLR
jgi:membrane associated rhomboid family serine protease